MKRTGFRRGRRGLLTAVGVLASAGVGGQMHKVARPETVVRAVGVYEWTGDLAKPKGERLVPVTIFIEGQVQDAGVYLARPVPMALGPGTVYELDEAGVEKGLVDLKEARHVQLPAAADATPYDDGWFGYGSFEAPKPPRVVAVKKTTQQVAVNGKVPVDTDPDRPKFSSKSAPVGSGETARPDPGSPEDVKVDSGSGDKDDVDRPTLRRRAPVDPKDAKKARKERDLSSVTPGAKSLNDDPDRPRMKRNAAAAEDEMAPLNGLPGDMRQMVAVSDPKRRDPHPFARAWEDEAEHQAVLGKMRTMAQAQLVAYGPVPAGTPVAAAGSVEPAAGTPAGSASAGGGMVAQDTSNGNAPVLRRNRVAANAAATEQVKAAPVPAAAPPSAGASTAGAAKTKTTTASTRRGNRKARPTTNGAPPAGTVLVDEEVRGFTLSYGGAATYVYTAHTAGTGAALRYVTVVAQEDGVNGLRMAMQAVTDAGHLDRQPWLRFVDVVDVEASNRASLLFELRGQTSRQFGLYRVVGGKADTLFVGGTTQ